MHLTIPTIILFFTFLVNLSVAIFVFVKSNKEKHKIIFGVIVLLIALWNIINFFCDTLTEKEHVILAIELAIIPVLFIPNLFLYFTFLFKKKELNKNKLFLLFLPSFLSIPFAFTKYNISGFHGEIRGSNFIPGPIYIFYIIYFFIFITWGFVNLIKYYRETKLSIIKKQISFILFGGSITGLSGIMNDAILPLLVAFSYSVYGNIFSITFGIFSAYAITRYRFMDLKVIIKKSLIYTLSFIIAISLVISSIIFLYFILINFINIQKEVSLIIITALLIVILPSLQKHLKNVINKYIKTDLVDLSVVDNFVKSISQTQHLYDIIQKTEEFLKDKLKTEEVKFIIRDFRVPELRYIYQYPETQKESLGDLKEIKEYFDQEKVLVKEEMPYLENIKQFSEEAIKSLKRFLNKTKAKIIISLDAGDIINGYILLGTQQEEEMYSKEDIDFLKRISWEIGGHISQVVFYEETVARVRREFGDKR